MGINHDGLHIFVTQQRLHGATIVAILQQMSRKTMKTSQFAFHLSLD